MHHDLCYAQRRVGKKICDIAFVRELNWLKHVYGDMPRELEWAKYYIRARDGGGWTGMPFPEPGDPMDMLDILDRSRSCW